MNFILIKNNFSINWTTNDKKSPLLNNHGLIGLHYNNLELKHNILFIKSLKKTKIINNYLLSIIFENENNSIDNNGYLIIGEEISEGNFKYINDEQRYGLIKWDIVFDEIFSFNGLNTDEKNKKFFIKNHQVQLSIDKPYIIGIDVYEYFIYIYFFQILIEKGISVK